MLSYQNNQYRCKIHIYRLYICQTHDILYILFFRHKRTKKIKEQNKEAEQ